MTQPSQYTLYVRPRNHNPNKPFDGDLFNRKQLANQLTDLVARLSEGSVFAIEAPWGEGKTWFAKNWQAQLRQQGLRSVLIDVFKHDHVDDPFLMICSEVMSEIDEENGARGEIAEAGKKVARALLPVAAKALINLGGRILLGSNIIAAEITATGEELNKDLGNAIENHLEKRLDAFEVDRQSVDGFAATLSKHILLKGKTLVVLIDELDRCRPDFAVKTIERIKHFFDVPGIVFVLLVNRPQLEAYIRGVYGAEVDAAAYLGKFIQFWLKLPKTTSLEMTSRNHNRIYCEDLERRFGLHQIQNHQAFLNEFSLLATLMEFSLRDLERGYTLFSLAQPISNAATLVAWPIVLKLKHPEIFTGILSGEIAAHKKAEILAGQFTSRSNTSYALPLMGDLHRYHASNFSTSLIEETRRFLSSTNIWMIQPQGFIPWLFGRIDLNIEN